MPTTACGCGHLPAIILPGIGQSKVILVDDAGNKLKNGWPLEVDGKDFLRPVLLPALGMLLTRQNTGVVAAVKKGIRQLLDPIACNPDGTRKHKAQVVSYPYSLADCTVDEKRYINKMVPTGSFAKEIGEDHLFFFAYDIFGEIEKTAAELDAYIQMVKAATGHSQVNLIPVSMGATIATAYFADFGQKQDVHRVVGVVPAWDGSVLVSELLHLHVDAENYEDLFVALLGKSDTKKIMKYLRYVPKKLIPKLILAIFESALETILVNSSTMWGVVPAQAYPHFCAKYLADPAHAALKAVCDKQYRERADFAAVVQRESARGVSFFSLCGCGVPVFGAVQAGNVNADMVVHTASASMGAHCVALGEALPADYRQQNLHCGDAQHNHIAPDRSLDASCGVLAETTWYFSGMEHEQAADNEQLLQLVAVLLRDDALKTVHQDPAYPQFCRYTKEG